MNKKMKTMLLSLGLVGVVGTGATLAYFTAGPEQVNNTFTFGKGYGEDGFKLIEHKYDNSTKKLTSEEVSSNDYQNVNPGQTLPKDPTIKLKASVKSYVYITVKKSDDVSIAANDVNFANWREVGSTSDGAKMYFYDMDKNEKPDVVDEEIDLKVFDNVTISGDVGNDPKGLTMDIKAAAIQATDNTFDDEHIQDLHNIAKGLFEGK